MDVNTINLHLSRGDTASAGVLPHLDALRDSRFVFDIDFGLAELPREAGVILVRGPRQYGKSTWLESEVRRTIAEFGPATAYLLNGDECATSEDLVSGFRRLVASFRADAPVRRVFVDEITAVVGWERALKLLLDAGELRDVLVVTTGSSARDLRRGAERLPGRKGRLDRTTWLFTPLSYRAFRIVAEPVLGGRTLAGYLLSGGCPHAAAEVVGSGRLPEFTIETVRDWMLGGCAAAGRDRASLVAVLDVLLRRGGTPIGQALLAREAGLANNTVAAGYLEFLADLLCFGYGHAFDPERGVVLRRKPAKSPVINLLAAVAWDRDRLRSLDDVIGLPAEKEGRWLEWLVAQELFRRAAIRGSAFPENLPHWNGGGHELDFVAPAKLFVEVQRGRTGPLDFAWFSKSFPNARLVVVGRDRFQTDHVRGVTVEDFLLDESWRH